MLPNEPNLLAREVNELIVGLVGIGLTLGVQWLAKRWQNRILEKKFPVAGKYLTRYVDQGKVYTDMVVFQQFGRKLKGESIPNVERNLASRKWIFRGDILPEGYVQGSYKPEVFTDKGFGAFFVKFEKNADMTGYWIGKDADESKLVSGEYSFLRQPSFTLSAIDLSDYAQVLRIAEDRLGDAYIERGQLTTTKTSVAFCARVGGTAVAFATARMLAKGAFLQGIRDRMGEGYPSLLPLERRVQDEAHVGFVASAATDPQFEGRGIGADLVEKCMAELEARGANVLVATAWKSTKGVQAGSILECRGFQRLMELPNYWEKDSLSNGYSCPICGKPPCHCSAIIYVRNRRAQPEKGR